MYCGVGVSPTLLVGLAAVGRFSDEAFASVRRRRDTDVAMCNRAAGGEARLDDGGLGGCSMTADFVGNDRAVVEH